MLVASVIVHFAMGILLALIFILYYINGNGKWKLFLETLIGAGGNVSGIFILDNLFKIDDSIIRMYSIAGCIIAFLLSTFLLLLIFSFVIKDSKDKDIIRLRDIMLGQKNWINQYYEQRAEEIRNKLNIPALEAREVEISKKEASLKEKEDYLQDELKKFSETSKQRLCISLPENARIALNKEYIDAMPSYIANAIMCIKDIDSCTKLITDKPKEKIDLKQIKSYFMSLATYISTDLFGGNSPDVRIHFRNYDPVQKGYIKLVAVTGNKPEKKELTVIPYADNSMIKKSYECRRALIKSINSDHDYQSKNHSLWQDYMTYTFYDILFEEIPLFSFGISVKNATRYKKSLHLLNYFRIEDFLQNTLEQVNEYVSLTDYFGGSGND